MTYIAKQAQAKADAERESLDLLASAKTKEAHQARARAQEAEKRAEVYKDIAEDAGKFAHYLYKRAMQKRSGVEVWGFPLSRAAVVRRSIDSA